MPHHKNPGYQPGNHWVTCDVCGQDIRASEIKMRWDGLAVCKKDWEPRHPLDFIRARADKEIPSGPVRPPVDDTTTVASTCTLEGRQSIAGYGVAGCMVAGLRNYTPPRDL